MKKMMINKNVLELTFNFKEINNDINNLLKLINFDFLIMKSEDINGIKKIFNVPKKEINKITNLCASEEFEGIYLYINKKTSENIDLNNYTEYKKNIELIRDKKYEFVFFISKYEDIVSVLCSRDIYKSFVEKLKKY